MNRKGFTLVELLAVIAIIAVIMLLVYFTAFGSIGSAKDEIDKTEKRLILSAAETFAKEYRGSDDWNEYVDGNYNSSFCISLESLIKKGYYKTEDQKIIKMAKDYVVTIKINNGVYNSTLIRYDELDDKSCYGYSGDFDLDNNKKNITYVEGDTEVISVDIDINQTGNYVYNTNIRLKNFLDEIGNIEVTTPIYVALIMDTSGSMNGTKLNNALNAVKNLASSVINGIDSSYVALVKYADIPSLVRDFKHEDLNNVNISTVNGGGTNTSGGIDITSRLFYNVKDKYAKKYAILLYDGEPTSYSSVKVDGKTYSPVKSEYFDKVVTTNISLSSYSNCSNDSYYNYRCNDYVQASSNYLTSMTGDYKYSPELLTIGYDFDNSNDELKKVSSIDNDLCADSDYYVPDDMEVIYSNDGRANSSKLDFVDNSVFFPFTYNSSNGSLTSSNKGIDNSVSYGYLELDLSSKSSSDIFSVDFNIDFNGYYRSSDYSVNYRHALGFIDITTESSFSGNLFDKLWWNECTESWNNQKICFYQTHTNSTYSTSLYGGKKYYIHLRNEILGTGTGSNQYFKINKITLTDSSGGSTIFDGNFSDISGNNIFKLSSKEESKVVYGFNDNNGSNSLYLSRRNLLGYSYLPIELPDKDNTYVAYTNTAVSGGYIGQHFVALDKAIGKQKMISYYSYWPSASTVNERRLGHGNNYFKLNNDSDNYIHFYFDTGMSSGISYNINDMALYKVEDQISNYGFDFNTNNNYNELRINNVLVDDSNAFSGFILDNNNLMSNNKEVKNSYSHSYLKVDLSDKSSSNYYAISSKFITSANNNDRGLIIVSQNSTLSNISSLKNTSTYSSDILLGGSIYYANEERYVVVPGGRTYYVHFLFIKENTETNSSGDSLIVNNVKVYNAKLVRKMNSSEVVAEKDYSFEVDNGKLVSGNNEVKSASHSYLKVDLSGKSSSDLYKLTFNDTINSVVYNYGNIVISTSYYSPNSYDLTNTIFNINNISGGVSIIANKLYGNNTEDHTEILKGGQVYYVHFFFSKYYDEANYFNINHINLTKVEKKTTDLDLSLIKPMYEQTSFNVQDNKYISTVTPSNIDSGYVKVDLTNYSGTYDFNIETESTRGSNGYSSLDGGGIFITDNPNRINIVDPSNSNGAIKYLKSLREGNNNLFTTLEGGKVYYIHFVNKTTYSNKMIFKVNSVSIFKTLSKNYYCYYESDSDKILDLFDDISTSIKGDIDVINAEVALVTFSAYPGLSFKHNGNLVDKIEYNINLKNKDDIKDIIDNFDVIINKEALSSCDDTKDVCTVEIPLFSSMKIDIMDKDGDLIKTISITENIPSVTARVSRFNTMN